MHANACTSSKRAHVPFIITRIEDNLSLIELGLTSQLELSFAKRESAKRTSISCEPCWGGPIIKKRKNLGHCPLWGVGLKKTKSQFQFWNVETPWEGFLNFQKMPEL